MKSYAKEMNNFDFTSSITLIMAACVTRLFIPYLTGLFRNITIEIITAFILCKTCQISEYKAWISMIPLLTVLFPGETSIHYIRARIQIFGLFWGLFWKCCSHFTAGRSLVWIPFGSWPVCVGPVQLLGLQGSKKMHFDGSVDAELNMLACDQLSTCPGCSPPLAPRQPGWGHSQRNRFNYYLTAPQAAVFSLNIEGPKLTPAR